MGTEKAFAFQCFLKQPTQGPGWAGPSLEASSAIASNTAYFGARGTGEPGPSVFVTLSVQTGD